MDQGVTTWNTKYDPGDVWFIKENRGIGLCEHLPHALAFDVLNVQGTRDGKEILDSTTNMEAASKQIKGNSWVQDHIDVAVTEPTSPTVGLDVMNMQGTRDENETLVSLKKAADKQIKGIRVVEVQATDVQLKLLDWMIDFKDNEQGMMVSGSSKLDDAPKLDYMHCTQSSQYVSELMLDDGFN
ncbi:unnamed protein product [Prunus armeniaca]|uniref:Uncharacterized protein n=1 Tax=Prunus armeniaca TaxID=36596 RepID=A0A6J5X9P0_PRUAR|nr:unnamed protein product [Prunus armeniaca]